MKKYVRFYSILLSLFLFLTFLGVTSTYAHREGVDKCLTAGFWVEDSVYDYFDPSKNPDSKNTFGQWADNQMNAWNKILVESGAKDCFEIGKIVQVGDGELPLRRKGIDYPEGTPDSEDKTVDVQWGFPKENFELSLLTDPDKEKNLNGIDVGLFHEWSHQRYLVDLYALDLNTTRDKIEITDPSGTSIVGTYFKTIEFDVIYYNKYHDKDLMSDTNPIYSPYSRQALNLIAGKHIPQTDRKYGIYLEDLPRNNVLRILDRDGMPISGAKVRIFQSVALNPREEQYAKKIDNIADVKGFTDINGEILIGHNPFGEDKGRGNYKDRKISPALTNGLFILEVSIDNQLDYKIIEVTDFNLAYWAGAIEKAVYEIKTNLTIPQTPTPTKAPDIITKLNCQNECSTKKEGQDLNNCLTSCYAKHRPTPTPTLTPTPIPTITVPIQGPSITPTPTQVDNFTIKFHYFDSNGNPLKGIYLNGQVVTVTVENLTTRKIIIEKINQSDLTFPLPKVGSDKIRITANPISGYVISSSPCYGGIECDSPDRHYFDLNTVDLPVSSFMPEELRYINVYFKYTPASLISPTSKPTLIPTFPQDQVPTPTPTLSLETPTPILKLTPTLPPTVTLPTSTLTLSPEPPTSTPTPIERKRIIGITINDADIDINNPIASIRLPGTEGEANKFIIPVIITYSDGTSRSISLVFDYSPLQPPTLTPTSIPEAQNSYQQPTSPSTSSLTPIPSPTRTPTPTPTPTAAGCNCDINQKAWISYGGCGYLGCASNEMPQVRTCDINLSCSVQKRCFPDARCPTPTPTVVPGSCSSYKSDFIKCFDKGCKWTGSLCVDK